MRNSHIYILVILFLSLSTNAQKNTKQLPEVPVSIYTFSKISTDKNSFNSINKKLNLNNFNFTFVTIIDNEFNEYSVDVNNVYSVQSSIINDNLKRYQNRNLLKGFLIKNDPTRWNFHCPSPLSVQPTE